MNTFYKSGRNGKIIPREREVNWGGIGKTAIAGAAALIIGTGVAYGASSIGERFSTYWDMMVPDLPQERKVEPSDIVRLDLDRDGKLGTYKLFPNGSLIADSKDMADVGVNQVLNISGTVAHELNGLPRNAAELRSLDRCLGPDEDVAEFLFWNKKFNPHYADNLVADAMKVQYLLGCDNKNWRME